MFSPVPDWTHVVGTFQMCPICYYHEIAGLIQPKLSMFSTCNHWFQAPLPPVQTDGATERVNRMITQMIRQCIGPDQRDLAMKLPAVEFAINSVRLSTVGFSPFELNYGRNPSSMIWKSEDEFPGVQRFAEWMKLAIMSAHTVGNGVQSGPEYVRNMSRLG